MLRAFVLLVVGCGASMSAAERLATSPTDVSTVRGMLRPPFGFGGLLWRDPVCTREFASATVISVEKAGEFGRCLATLHLERSTRHGSMPGAEVFTYAPGIEIEVRFDAWRDGDFIAWIGFVARRGNQDALPTISNAALEQLRVAGDRDAKLDETTRAAFDSELKGVDRKDAREYSWLKLCLDSAGNVTSTHLREASSPDANETFAYPVNLKGDQLPLPDAPDAEDYATGRINPLSVNVERIEGLREIHPDDGTKRAIYLSGLRRLVGIYNVCLAETGKVRSIQTIKSTSAPSYDSLLTTTMSHWVYKPPTLHGQPTTICTKVVFIYSQQE